MGVGEVDESDCQEVKNAVTATEMELQPPVAQPPQAPYCDPGQLLGTTLFFDDMEKTNSGNWMWPSPGLKSFYSTDYAASGTHSLHGEDPDYITDTSITKSGKVAVPTGKPTYLRFEHAYEFGSSPKADNPYERFTTDGGVLEYSTNNGADWIDAGSLFTDSSGYNGKIVDDGFTFGNPLADRQAFVDKSYGYGASRIDLTSLAGQNVLFRFRIGTDSYLGDLGWRPTARCCYIP